MTKLPFAVCTPWHNPEQRDKFLAAWGIMTDDIPPYLFLQQDTDRSGCAITKNRAIQCAYDAGAEVIIVLDDDCFPSPEDSYAKNFCHWRSLCNPTPNPIPKFMRPFENFAEAHVAALEPKPVQLFRTVTTPFSRGTPFLPQNRTVTMPVAASMGHWTEVGDYDAPSQLVHGATHPMTFDRESVHGQYFALSGMNLAFRREWWPVAQFINVARYDDIWQGIIWQRIAYERGYCFNLAGPLVRHSRQSNVWANLRDETVHVEANDTLWQKIHASKATDYASLRALLPV